MEPNKLPSRRLDTKTFKVDYHPVEGAQTLLIIVGSAGLAFAGSRTVNEFTKTISNSGANPSCIWVIEKEKVWFNSTTNMYVHDNRM